MPNRPPQFRADYGVLPVAGLQLQPVTPRVNLDDQIREMDQQDIEAQKRRGLMQRLKLREAELEKERTQLKKDILSMEAGEPPHEEGGVRLPVKGKRFDVIDGEIMRDDENGAYTLQEASILTRAQKHEGSTGLVELVGAVKGLAPGEQLKLTDFAASVKEIATMFQPASDGGLSQTELALTLENLTLKQSAEMKALVDSLSKQLVTTGQRNGEPSLITDGEGNVVPNPRGLITGMELLLLQAINNSRNPMVWGKDGAGNVMPIDSFIKLEGWKNEERRKDDTLNVQREALGLAKQHAPDVIAALRGLKQPQGKAQESLARGGWANPGKPSATSAEAEGINTETPSFKRVACNRCEGEILYSAGTKLIECPQCREPYFLGTEEELQKEVARWQTYGSPAESSTKSTPAGEGLNEGISSRRSEKPSSPSLEP